MSQDIVAAIDESWATYTSQMPAGSPWWRGGAICSIALLLLGGALVVYGGALMTVGHRPLPEGALKA